MKQPTLSLLLCLALLVLCSALALARPLRILPLGDSITQGGRDGRPEYSYRYPLYFLLKDAGYDVHYIGSLRGGLNPDFVWPDYHGVPFDPIHEGHYGWKTGAVRDHLAEWMKTYTAPPDVVLIHLGTNDQSSKDYQTDIITPLTQIITRLRAANPHLIVLVAHLPFNGGAALQIRPLVEKMAKDLTTRKSPVVTVPIYRGWHENPDDIYSDTFDWAHPNVKGQEKLAGDWFTALQPYLKPWQPAVKKK